VVAVGAKVTDFQKGDRVMSGLARNPCGQCDDCKGPNDIHQYCRNTEGGNGVTVDGAFAEYHVADARVCCHVPDAVSFTAAAPLACAGCTIYRAIIVSEVKEGAWLALVGAGGGLGHLGIQFAKAKGINLVAIDARDEGLELCKEAGADHVLDARKGNNEVVKQVQDLTGGRGVHAAVNVSEHPTAAALACAVTRMHGIMVQVAQPDEVCIPFHEVWTAASFLTCLV